MAKVRSKDVAKHSGVSPATVSHAVNNTRFVGAETRQKVLDAILGTSLSSHLCELNPHHPNRRRPRQALHSDNTLEDACRQTDSGGHSVAHRADVLLHHKSID